jgi:hypothetical protein
VDILIWADSRRIEERAEEDRHVYLADLYIHPVSAIHGQVGFELRKPIWLSKGARPTWLTM